VQQILDGAQQFLDGASYSNSVETVVEDMSYVQTCSLAHAPEDLPTNEIETISKEYIEMFPDNVYDVFINDKSSRLSESDYYPESSESDTENNREGEISLHEKLANWATEFHITHSALSGLLDVLSNLALDLPKDPRTLLKTDITVACKEICGGSYCYLGIKTGLLNELSSSDDLFSSLDRNDIISIQVNIDGLPLFKSSSIQFWPILGLIEIFDKQVQINKNPFLIGLFCGNKKPTDLNEFFKEFVDEAMQLQNEGISFNEKHYDFNISSFICDTPARAFIKATKGHSGYFGCDKCTQHGTYNGRVTFPQTNAPLRTNTSFRQQLNREHHTGYSPLCLLSLDMVSQFPTDYMHLICLGVVKKLVFLWVKGPLKTRIGPRVINDISSSLIEIRPYTPKELARKPRAITEFERWKATEFRTLLLYTGIVSLQNLLPKQLYDNFMLLSVSMTILLSARWCEQYADSANSFLITFVNHFIGLFGEDMVSYNVHGLVHLTNEAKKFGPLDNVSSFPFENFLGMLKRLIRKPNFPLQQVIRRLSENHRLKFVVQNTPVLKREHFRGPIIQSHQGHQVQYDELVTKNFCLRTTNGDKCITLKCGEIALVQNIVRIDKNVTIVYKKFNQLESFFSYPCQSSDLGIYKVSSLSTTNMSCLLSDVLGKNILIPNNGFHVAIPFLHS
jgi:hypothetical protein